MSLHVRLVSDRPSSPARAPYPRRSLLPFAAQAQTVVAHADPELLEVRHGVQDQSGLTPEPAQSSENSASLRPLPFLLPLFRTRSAAVYGIDAHLIDVEVDLWASGNARDFITVGMPDTAVRESRERIKSALLNSGFGLP